MRISDWSSDVCSSDLFQNNSSYLNGANSIFIIEILTPLGPMLAGATSEGICLLEFVNRIKLGKEFIELQELLNAAILPGRNKHLDQLENEQIGRASCRERVCQYV